MMGESIVLHRFPNARIYDLSPYYSEFVPFTANSVYPVHRWYRFKEGFSRDLVHLILGSIKDKVNVCLDPFAGSGTTALACQEIGIKCYSIEVNPFLHHISRVKLVKDYNLIGFDKAIEKVKYNFKNFSGKNFDEPIMSTITERPNLEKWLFSRPVLQAILALRESTNEVEPIYADLLIVVLASILTDIGNTIKDGKCVRYKNDWRENKFTRDDVGIIFFERAKIFRDDIQSIENSYSITSDNANICLEGNALQKLKLISGDSIDAVITSPPYLNSFDYTDVYMPELWALGFVNSYKDVRQIRNETVRSHVQVRWKRENNYLHDTLGSLIADVVENPGTLWNSIIPDMIGGYFLDMQEILGELQRVLRSNGKLYLVVGTSSYNEVFIPTDLLLAEIAEDLGFDLEEIRIMRKLKQSKKKVEEKEQIFAPMRESMLILRKKGI
ncbi:MAG: hypothetical protein EXR62_05190 [Chloroflexi bacterium]|nr:hypothetical protein [Chloroflexota bacterium]